MRLVEERKDARKKLSEARPIVAICKTRDFDFEASIYDVSSGGVFILTKTPVSTGQEITIKFSFPKTGNTIMATGEVVRVSNEGVGVKFKIFFRNKDRQFDMFEMI
jgi:Tfp pilus assembly protein PilZ